MAIPVGYYFPFKKMKSTRHSKPHTGLGLLLFQNFVRATRSASHGTRERELFNIASTVRLSG